MLFFSDWYFAKHLKLIFNLVLVGLGGSKGMSRRPKMKEYQYLLVPVPEGKSNFFSATGEFCSGF